MLKVDLHTHSLHSHCGNHSILEIVNRAKELGMEAIAITDHGPLAGRNITSTFYKRLHNPVDGITLLKGMECNLGKQKGEIDVPRDYVRYMDVILLGIHSNTQPHLDKNIYTELLIAAIENNPFIDILTHTNDPAYPVDYHHLLPVAQKYQVAIELNNSKTQQKVASDQTTSEMLQLCKKYNCPIAINSDTHTINEVGDDSAVRHFIEETQFPQHLIINRDLKSTTEFLAAKRDRKLSIT